MGSLKTLDLSGVWACDIPGVSAPVRLPGTLDESGIGFPDDPLRQWKLEELRARGLWREGDPILTRLTRKFTYEGPARISRMLEWDPPENGRIFLECGRARHLRLLVNGKEAAPYRPATLSTPYVFEVTELLTGRDEFVFLSDNSCPGWPRDAILYSSAASDETQTNWNGILGYVRLRFEKQAFISDLRVYPGEDSVDVVAELDCLFPCRGTLSLRSDALEDAAADFSFALPGRHEVAVRGIGIRPGAARWDENNGVLQSLTAVWEGVDRRTVSFGLRTFAARNGGLALNGRRIFLRGETNCALFPETGHMPMDPEAWKSVLLKYRSYGVNCVRFHSHCPPEAAFAAADELGILMQPELSHWDPEHAFASPESREYYRTELLEILRHLANHPSFVMLTLGNELQADADGLAFMNSLPAVARRFDPTRLYANGSNPFYGQMGPDPSGDFYTSSQVGELDLRAASSGVSGWLNREYPDFRRNYDAAVASLRRRTDQPVFSFEVGQYEVLPDFDELADYRGVTVPDNLERVRSKVRSAGWEDSWKQRVEASGDLALLCYRAEVEAALRTPGFSGISLLGLQDFSGQGTALIGMMNAHLEPKPYPFARPERFSAFFRPVLPLVLLPRFTWTAGEAFTAEVKLANYGNRDLRDSPRWELSGPGEGLCGALSPVTSRSGELTPLGTVAFSLPAPSQAEKRVLTVTFAGERNEYPLWIYPDAPVSCPESVHECAALDDRALSVLSSGGTVYLSPEFSSPARPPFVQPQFSTDFWSVCTFPEQSGTMGQLIDAAHPLFDRFPTQAHTDWQWWPMAGQPALVVPATLRPIVAVLDSYALMRPLAQLFECRCGGGRLLVSSLGLHALSSYPEARALQRAVYAYLASEPAGPLRELSRAEIKSILGEAE